MNVRKRSLGWVTDERDQSWAFWAEEVLLPASWHQKFHRLPSPGTLLFGLGKSDALGFVLREGQGAGCVLGKGACPQWCLVRMAFLHILTSSQL